MKWLTSQVFRLSEAVGFEILQKPDYGQSDAVAINDTGVVAGSVMTWNGQTMSRAATWIGSRLTLIDSVPGFRSTTATDINNSGQVLIRAR